MAPSRTPVWKLTVLPQDSGWCGGAACPLPKNPIPSLGPAGLWLRSFRSKFPSPRYKNILAKSSMSWSTPMPTVFQNIIHSRLSDASVGCYGETNYCFCLPCCRVSCIRCFVWCNTRCMNWNLLTYTHSVFTAIFPGVPGSTGCPLSSHSPFIPELRNLLGQT